MKLDKIIRILFVCFALSPNGRAVLPPPDGAYPNFTTAEGQNALQDLTSGAGNTALGAYSLFSTTTASFNTAVGAAALDLNTGDSNTAVGVAALLLNTGVQNTAVGVDALGLNTSGGFNAAVGAFALYMNTGGESNSAFGWSALNSNTNGDHNSAMGVGALFGNTTGVENTASGANALQSNNTGSDNTAIGFQALFANVVSNNTAVGAGALASNATGGSTSGNDDSELGPNTAVGANALNQNTEGGSNTDLGFQALGAIQAGGFSTAVGFKALANSTQQSNDAFGYKALVNNTMGFGNVAVGDVALFSNTSGSNNVAVGNRAGFQSTGDNNIYIGSFNSGVPGESDACYIKSIFGQTSVNGTPVLINGDHKLGTTTSSKRFKEQIKPMDNASEVILAFKPVTFRYKHEIDPAGISQFGLVAEDAEKIDPDLVVRDKEGKPYSVRYDQVNAMLLNEFLKEHRAFVQEQCKVADQQKEIDALKAELKEQRSLIQKVSDKVVLTKSATKIATRNP